MCIDNKMGVVNNLKHRDKYLSSDKTYKQGNSWVSELDICLESYDLIEYINKFRVYLADYLSSDHAPISLQMSLPKVDIDSLLRHASLLGEYATLMNSIQHNRMVNKPIKMDQINNEMFIG